VGEVPRRPSNTTTDSFDLVSLGSHAFLVQEPKEILGRFESSKPIRNILFFRELCDSPKHGQILIRDFKRRSYDEKQAEHRSPINGLEFDSLSFVAERQPQAADDEGPPMRYGDASSYTSRAEIFAPLKNSQESSGGTLVGSEQRHHFCQNFILGFSAEREGYSV